jgi:hypothetical protein
MRIRVSIGALVALLAAPPLLHGQTAWVTGYYQNVPLWSREGALSSGGPGDFNRVRLSIEPVLGALSLEAAYEQVVTLRQEETAGLFVGIVPGGGEWLDLQWTIAGKEHVLWQHRFDRLSLNWRPTRALELSAGRQAVSWATTLLLSPADPFSPFSPADPFRLFRAGVDAVRVRAYPGPLSEIDLVLRPSKNDALGEEMTVLGRGLTVWKGWEVSGWGGSLYGDITGAFGTTGAIGETAVRGEGVVRRIDGDTVFQGTIGLDRRFSVDGKDLYLVFEYQRNGLAAPDSQDYAELLQSDPFRRGELQVFGRDETALQVSYQIHPLWNVGALWLWNLNDHSALLSPSFTYSAGNEISVSGGAFFGMGDDDVTTRRPLPSEYGLAGTTLFVSIALFF